MTFDPGKKFEVLPEFDATKPFEILDFNPKKPFKVIEEKELPKPLIKDYVKTETPASKLTEEDVNNLIREAIKKFAPPPQKVIEKTIEKEVVKEVIKKEEKKDDTKYAEEKSVEELKKEITDLKDSLEKLKQVVPMLGGSGISRSNDIYIPSNVTITRNYDATSTSLDEVASVLGSLILSLKSAGLIQ